MPDTNQTDAEIRARIDDFLTQIGTLVRKTGLESVRLALGGVAPPTRRRRPADAARPRPPG